MRDISKKLTVINTGNKESEAGTASQPSGVVYVGAGGGGGVGNLKDYLLKSIWDRVWEIRTDSQGTEYIFGKLPVVTQYGITMYSGDNVDIPTIAEGLPFDNRTIWFNTTTKQIEVIGGTGGGSGEGVSNFWDLSDIPSWITNTKPTYSYTEIQGTPDLSVYALKSAIPSLEGYAKLTDIPSLSGYATEQWVLDKGYALSSDLSKYIPIAGATDITGEKNFIGGLKVNGSPIYYDTEKKYWKLEGDLLVTGGVTMYGNDSDFVASTIMGAILYDDTTLGINANGQLYVKGGTGGVSGDYLPLSGGVMTGWIGLPKGTAIYDGNTHTLFGLNTSGDDLLVGHNLHNLTIRSYDTTIQTRGDSLRHYNINTGVTSTILDSSNWPQYITAGDGGSYLPLSGGIISGTSAYPLVVNTTDVQSGIQFLSNNDLLGVIINGGDYGTALINFKGKYRALGIDNDGNAYTTIDYSNTKANLLHTYNYSSYALPLSGGTLSGDLLFDNNNHNRIIMSRRGNYAAIGNDYNKLLLEFKYSTYSTYHGMMIDEYGLNYTLRTDNGTIEKYKVWNEYNDGSGSGLDADLLDGYDSSYIMKHGGNWTASTDTAGIFAFGFGGSSAGLANNYGAGIQLCNAQGVNAKPSSNNSNSNWYSQLLFGTDNRVYARFNTNGGGWSGQNKIAYVTDNVASATRIQAYQHNSGEYTLISGTRTDNTFPRSIYDNGWALCVKWQDSNGVVHNGYIANLNDNVASATKLQTARTIWGQSFDGTADVSGSIYFDSGIIGTYETVKANEFTSIIAWKNTINSMIGYVGYYSDHFIFANVANNTKENCAISAYDDGKIIFSGSNVGIGTTNPNHKLHISSTSSYQVLAIHSTGYEESSILYSNKSGVTWVAGVGGNDFFIWSKTANNSRFRLDSSGNGLFYGGVTMYSDSRKKTILNHVELSLQQVANAPLIEHYYNSDQNKTTHVGSIAQYWAEMNDWFCKLDSEGYYTMEIQNAALASAISVARELVKFETETDRRIRLLEAENKRLKEEVEQLKWNIA
ncbi:MAG: hypothetical protein U0M06_02735 [Clostridia bacterium]|nr:hypothetical protein [Clostridia bacterium]